MWIQTFTNKKFFPLMPSADEVDIEDIAHALAMKCRFGGHCKTFYSVAQHSILVSINCREFPLWGLLHDAAEAYLPDVCKPIKPSIPGFELMERRVMRCIAARFGLPWPAPLEVKEADFKMLLTEARDLMGPPPEPWYNPDKVVPFKNTVVALGYKMAKELFLEQFAECISKRNH